MTITASDVPRVAAAMRVAGELFEVHGGLMLSLTSDWQAGAKAANLDPDSGGNRWENCGPNNQVGCLQCPHAIPSDPTGEAAVAARRVEMASELQIRLERLVADAQWIRDAAHVLAPIVPPSTMNARDTILCVNCLRIGLGSPRHRGDLCRECYEFKLMWQVPRPPTLIKWRHDGRPLNDKIVKQALEAEGMIVKTVGGVTKAIRQARSRKPNQNQKKKAG